MLVLELAPTAYFDIFCLLYLSLLYLLGILKVIWLGKIYGRSLCTYFRIPGHDAWLVHRRVLLRRLHI